MDENSIDFLVAASCQWINTPLEFKERLFNLVARVPENLR